MEKRPGDSRNACERDRSRVIHSAAFRRLQAKTQILGVLEGDFHRTRLTHSMEVAQIGRGLVLQLRNGHPEQSSLFPSLETIETIGLAHDLGHPPFGHGGEAALNFMMRSHGGFEGNGQSLRLLTLLESHTPGYGLNLTRRTLLGVLKYPVPFSRVNRKEMTDAADKNPGFGRREWNPPKCHLDEELKVVDWILEPLPEIEQIRFREFSLPGENEHGHSLFRSLDTSILNIADDIAYGVHDLEDAIALRLMTRDHWSEISPHLDSGWAKSMQLEGVGEMLFSNLLDSGHSRKRAVGALVNALICSVRMNMENNFEDPLLALQAELTEEAALFLRALKETVSRHVIQLNTVQTAASRGRRILAALFETLSSEAERLLPDHFLHFWEIAGDERERMRVICDYIAGMTDQYANRMYSRLFIPGEGSVFDRL